MRHIPIMYNNVNKEIKNNKKIIDCTFGFGGHLIKNIKKKKIDLINYEIDKKYFLFNKKYKNNKFLLFNKCFTEIDKNNLKVNIVFIDLGFSRNQILNPSTGISKKNNLKLNTNINKNRICIRKQKETVKLIIKKKNITFTKDIIKNVEFYFYKIRNFINEESKKIEIVIRKSFKILSNRGKILILCYNFLEVCNITYFIKKYKLFLKIKKKKINKNILYVIIKR